MTSHADTNEGLVVEGLTVGFSKNPLVRDVHFSVSSGESVALMGRSGSGKSTLLWSILGLIKPLNGRVTVNGQLITGVSKGRQAQIRRTCMGVVFQQPQLVAELTPIENVMTPLLMSGLPRADAHARAQEMLSTLGLPDRDRVSQLSGGEQQRVSIARALVSRPSVIVADEPTAALDEDTAGEVIHALLSHARDLGAAVLLVTHSSQVAQLTDRVLRVEAQTVAEVALASEA